MWKEDRKVLKRVAEEGFIYREARRSKQNKDKREMLNRVGKGGRVIRN